MVSKIINKKYILIFFIVISIGILTYILYNKFLNNKEYSIDEIIEYWDKNDIIDSSDINFDAYKTITNAEFAKIITTHLGLKNETYDFDFIDVSVDHWAYDYIAACVQYNIFEGNGLGSFFPDNNISRQAVIGKLARITSYKSKDSANQLNKINDSELINVSAASAVDIFIENNIVSLYEDNTIRPTDEITLIELLKIMYIIDKDNAWKIPYNNKGTNIVKDFYFTSNNLDKLKIYPSIINGEMYLLLPNSLDVSSFSLKFNDRDIKKIKFIGDLGSTSKSVFDLRDISSVNDEGIYHLTISWKIKGKRVKQKINILHSKNINSMFIYSENSSEKGRIYVDTIKGNSIVGNMVLMTEMGEIIYDGNFSQIKTRGNSTSAFAKKPYQIKLETKSDLLNKGEKVKTWVLLANYIDATNIFDKLCKDMATNIGLDGTPDSDWINLYYDGEYRGLYLLSEKVDTKEQGLNIYDLEAEYEKVNEQNEENIIIENGNNSYGNEIQYISNVKDPNKIDEGYLIELNEDFCDENSCFKTSKKVAFNIKVPENLSKNAVNYISEFYQKFEDSVYAQDSQGNYTGINPVTGKAYYEYCDLTSLVKMYLIYQFSHNTDAYFRSTYFYLSNGKLSAGPMWDGDLTFGNAWNFNVLPDLNTWNNYLISALEKIPSFKNATKEYYFTTFRYAANQIIAEIIPKYVNKISDAERMNKIVWPVYYKWGNLEKTYPENAKYKDVINIKINWMKKRIEYLDQKFSIW